MFYLDFLIALVAKVASTPSHLGTAHREFLGGEVLFGLDLCGVLESALESPVMGEDEEVGDPYHRITSCTRARHRLA